MVLPDRGDRGESGTERNTRDGLSSLVVVLSSLSLTLSSLLLFSDLLLS
jgi:hypothetical protein